jgi:hypothetical protein
LAVLGMTIAALPAPAQALADPACSPAGCVVVLANQSRGTACCYTPGTHELSWGLGGFFEGVATMTLKGGDKERIITCIGLLVGEAMVSGTCTISGERPPLGVPHSVFASTYGAGVVWAFATGA